MDRYWLITSTTYGTWLPGDRRGFVSPVRAEDGGLETHNIPGTPCETDLPRLARSARRHLRGRPVRFTRDQAATLLAQFRETAEYRQWELVAAAVMPTHFHVVVGVSGDPDPSGMLRDLKSYGSRALNAHRQCGHDGKWWSESGSKRKLPDAEAVRAAVRYVRGQQGALVVWQQPESGS